MDVTIFYAWQFDRPGKTNRHLIRKAAEAACLRISEDDTNVWEVRLDSDTKGAAGMCDIPNTILKKIRKCDIILVDLTLVGKTEADPPKLLPNANVVFELGYAARQHGFDSLVGVLNDAFGKIEGQVFDIKRRACLTYTATEEATNKEREKVAEKLSKELEEIFRETIQTVVLPRNESVEEGRQNTAAKVQAELASKLKSDDFHGLRHLTSVLTSVQFRGPKDQDYEKAYEAVRGFFKVNPEVDTDSVSWSSDTSHFELSLNGHLFHAFAGDYRSVQNLFAFNARTDQQVDNDHFLPATAMQVNIVRHILQQCRFLHTIQTPPPWQIGISLIGAKSFGLLYPNGETARRVCAHDTVHLPIVRVASYAAVEEPLKVGNLLRRNLERLLRVFGAEYNPCYLENGMWNMRVFE